MVHMLKLTFATLDISYLGRKLYNVVKCDVQMHRTALITPVHATMNNLYCSQRWVRKVHEMRAGKISYPREKRRLLMYDIA